MAFIEVSVSGTPVAAFLLLLSIDRRFTVSLSTVFLTLTSGKAPVHVLSIWVLTLFLHLSISTFTMITEVFLAREKWRERKTSEEIV